VQCAGKAPPHDLRHICASLAISAGVNVLALERLLGRTSAKVTLDTYADLFDDDLDAVAVTLHSRYSRECAHGAILTSSYAKKALHQREPVESCGGGGGI
jgi:hypothetical protein